VTENAHRDDTRHHLVITMRPREALRGGPLEVGLGAMDPMEAP
jgi:hypothetical protein